MTAAEPRWPLLPSIAVYAVVWLAFGLVSGWVANRVAPDRLLRPGPLTRIRSWERGGRLYAHGLGIRRWKDRLPEQGDFFAGGMSKRRLPGPGDADLERFAAETRRAELVHWAQILFAPTFLLWNPPVIGVSMIVFAIVAHLPFVAVQRYNRARVERVLQRRRRLHAAAATDHDGVVQEDATTPDEQAEAEALDEETLGDEELQTDGLRAHDLDMVDSLADRARREEPDFDRRRPRRDHTAAQLVSPGTGSDPEADVLGTELPAEGGATAEESAMHLEDDEGHAV